MRSCRTLSARRLSPKQKKPPYRWYSIARTNLLSRGYGNTSAKAHIEDTGGHHNYSAMERKKQVVSDFFQVANGTFFHSHFPLNMTKKQKNVNRWPSLFVIIYRGLSSFRGLFQVLGTLLQLLAFICKRYLAPFRDFQFLFKNGDWCLFVIFSIYS